MRVCRECGGHVSPGNLKVRKYLCWKCARVISVASRRRYYQTAKGKNAITRSNAKRVFFGHGYAMYMRSEEQARLGQEHIRQRLREFHGATATEPE